MVGGASRARGPRRDQLSLDMTRNVLTVSWDTQRTTLSAIARGLDSLGYPPHPLGETRTEVVRLVTASCCWPAWSPKRCRRQRDADGLRAVQRRVQR